jgi:hypothetical protein
MEIAILVGVGLLALDAWAFLEWAAFLTGAAAIANLISGYPSNQRTNEPK